MAIRLTQAGEKITVNDVDLAVPNGSEGVSYTLNLITKKDYDEIVQKHTKRKPNKFTRQMEEVTDYNAVADDLTDRVLDSWTGVIVGDEGEPAPCDRAHKISLDLVRRRALHDQAGLSQVIDADEQKASSFRGTPSVR